MSKQEINASAFINAISELAKQKDISQQKIGDLLEECITKTYFKTKPEECIFEVKVDIDKGTISAYEVLEVIDCDPNTVYDDFICIPKKTVNAMGHNLNVGDQFKKPFDINGDFIRGEAAHVIQLLKQKLTEIDNVKIYKNWSPKIGTNVIGEVDSYDTKSNSYKIELEDHNKAHLHKKQIIPGEDLQPGRKYHFLVQDVKEQSKGWPIILSRSDVLFTKNWLILEVPELQNGEIVIERQARSPGFKTVFAVSTTNPTIDAAAICIGPKGVRVKAVSSKIANERIDIFRYDPDLKRFIVNVVGIENIEGIVIDDSDMQSIVATVIVKDDALAKVIGKKGSNSRLLALVTQCRLDFIKLTDAKLEGIEYTPINPDDYRLVLVKEASQVRNSDEIMDELEISGFSMDDMLSNATTSTFYKNPNSVKTNESIIVDDYDDEDQDLDDDLDIDGDIELLDDSFSDLV